MATGSYYDFFKSKRLLKTPAKQRRRPDLIGERGLLLQTLLHYQMMDQYAQFVGVRPITQYGKN